MILGIDEVGRGPWAGPLVIGAVILGDESTGAWYNRLTDSKQLSDKNRRALAKHILKESPATALGWVSAPELDRIGLKAALPLATRRAVKSILQQQVKFDEIIIDGTINFLAGTPLENHVTMLKKADLLIKEVSAASIIAKVARDDYMHELASQYPEYGFESHVGYGTQRHRAALDKYGPCPEHRRSTRPIAKFKQKDTTAIGRRAENVVAKHLAAEGHRIIAQNHKTRFYEIDIISTKDNKIYFTEVKYRENSNHGTPLEAITPAKERQMHLAAEAFLKYQPFFRRNFDPLLAAAAVSGPDFHLDEWLPLS